MELYPIGFVVVISLVFAIEVVVGLSLNIYSLINFYKLRNTIQQRKNKSGCNFVITLKIIDFVICATVIPITFFVQVIDKENNLVPCLMKEGLVIMATSGSSICIMLLSVDRYVAVVLPTRSILTIHRVKICKILLCMVALTGSVLPSLCFVMGSYHYGIDESVKHKSCRHIIWMFKPFFLYDLFYILPFVVAVVITGICYKAVLKVVKQRLTQRIMRVKIVSVPASSIVGSSGLGRFRAQEIKVQRAAFAATGCFLFCWGPHVAITVVQIVLPGDNLIDMIQSACLSLAFLSTIINPIMYRYQTNEKRMKQTLTIYGVITDFLRPMRRNIVVPENHEAPDATGN